MLSCTLPKLDKNTNLFGDILLWKQVWMTRAKLLPVILILKKIYSSLNSLNDIERRIQTPIMKLVKTWPQCRKEDTLLVWAFHIRETFFLVGCGHSKLVRGRIKFKRHKMFTKQGSLCWRVHSVGTEWIIVVFGDVLADTFTRFSCPVGAFLFPFRIFTMFKKIGDDTQWAA